MTDKSKLGDIYRSMQIKNTNIASTIQDTHENSKTTVASQTSPPKGIEQRNHVNAAKQRPKTQTGSEPVPFPNCCNSCPTDIQESGRHTTTTFSGDTTIPPLAITTPIIGERMVGDEQTSELYLSLTSTVVLK